MITSLNGISGEVYDSKRYKYEKLINLRNKFVSKCKTEQSNIENGIDYDKSELILGVYLNIVSELNKIID